MSLLSPKAQAALVAEQSCAMRDDDFDADDAVLYCGDDWRRPLPEEPTDFACEFASRVGFVPEESRSAPPAQLKIIRPGDHLGKEIPPREWIVPNWIPCGVVTGLYGDGAMGKSLLAQQLQTAATTGGEWCGLMVAQTPSIGFYCEDDEVELLRRQERLNRAYSVDQTDLANMQLVSRVGEDNELITFTRGGVGEVTAFQKQMLEAALDISAKLVVFDTAADGFPGNENDRGQVRRFVANALGSIARKIGGAVLLCAHPSRDGLRTGSGDGGSTGWNNTLRSRLYLSLPEPDDGKQPDENARILSHKKANYAGRNDSMNLLWNDGAFIVDRPGADIYRPPAETVFLDLLAATTREGRRVSENRMANNFAPRAFEKRADRKGYRKTDFEPAMERLFAAGKIVVDEDGPPSKKVRFIVPNGGSK